MSENPVLNFGYPKAVFSEQIPVSTSGNIVQMVFFFIKLVELKEFESHEPHPSIFPLTIPEKPQPNLFSKHLTEDMEYAGKFHISASLISMNIFSPTNLLTEFLQQSSLIHLELDSWYGVK